MPGRSRLRGPPVAPRARPGHRTPPPHPLAPGQCPRRSPAFTALRGELRGAPQPGSPPPVHAGAPWAAPAAEDPGLPLHRQGPGSRVVSWHSAVLPEQPAGTEGLLRLGGRWKSPGPFPSPSVPQNRDNVWGEGPGFTPFLPAPPSSPVASLSPPHWKPSLSSMCRTDTKMPSFSCILYALRVTHQAQVHGESVHFKKVREGLGWGCAAAPAALGMGSAGAPSPRRTRARTEGLCPAPR